jgi:hypothetical protein
MKTYKTPMLVAKGDVITMTQGTLVGVTDPDGRTIVMPSGSVGFSL